MINEPLNLALLQLSKKQVTLLSETTSMDRFVGTSSNLHPEGLFSVETFGRVGDDERDATFSYIDLKLKVMHPAVWYRLGRIRSLYLEILTGKTYAKWDPKLKDFTKATIVDGETGYQFFSKHFKDLDLKKNDSDVRNIRIDFINKYKDRTFNDIIPVMPAGLRDIEVDDSGNVSEHEINEHYRKLIGVSKTVGSIDGDLSPYNSTRLSMQYNLNNVHDTIINILKGKHGYILGKWMSRAINDGTRNVIAANDAAPIKLGDTTLPSYNHTAVGLWQTSRGVLPLTIGMLKHHVLGDVFNSDSGLVKLIDPKTLKSEFVDLEPKTYDKWTTNEGLEGVIYSQSVVEARSRPVMVDGRYMALVYRPKGENVFKIFYDIEDLPEHLSKDDVHPITLSELIYLAGYSTWNKLCLFATRYPVASTGSIYPSKVFCKTTYKSTPRRELDENWQPIEGEDALAVSYPNFENGRGWMDTMKIHPSRLEESQGDYDGDMMSTNYIYTREGIDEIHNYLNSREAYVNLDGGLRNSANTHNMALTMHNLTSDIAA